MYFMQEELEGSGSLPLDCTALLTDTALSTAIPDLANVIRNQPEVTLNQMALALHTVSEIFPLGSLYAIMVRARAVFIHATGQWVWFGRSL